MELEYQPLLVNITAEEGRRLKVLFASLNGFHAIDIDTNSIFYLHKPYQVGFDAYVI